MTPDDAEEYTQSLGQIVAGSWRQIAWADRQGIPAALGMSTREWVEERLGGYVRLAIPERREAVAELTAEGMNKTEIAETLGVDRATVRSDLRESSRDDPANQGCDSSERENSRPSPEELERARDERERREAIGRQVNRLRNLLDGWETVTHLHSNPLRAEVLDAIGDFDRDRVLNIEEVIHA